MPIRSGRAWREERFRAWQEESDRADRERGPVVAVDQLPGYVDAMKLLRSAIEHLSRPQEPGALTAGRSELRKALALIPQSKAAQYCYSDRYEERYPQPPEVCRTLTCGRCAPLRAAGAAHPADRVRTERRR